MSSRGLLGILLTTTVLSVHNYFLLQQIDRVESSPVLPSRGDDCTGRERESQPNDSAEVNVLGNLVLKALPASPEVLTMK